MRAKVAGLSADAKLANKYGCDERSIKRYRAAGAPLDKPKLMADWISAQHNVPKGSVPKTINDAKLRKLQLECDRLLSANEQTRGTLVEKATVTADIQVIAAAMQSRLAMLIGEAPNWAGLQAHEIQDKAKAFVRGTHEAFHDATSKLYT